MSKMSQPEYYDNIEKCVDDLIEAVGKKVVLAAPLALAKPNQLINALYQRTKTDPDFQFHLLTAITLEKPGWSSELEERFMKPLVERIWEDYPPFDYATDMRKNCTPKNFQLIEFFNKAGAWMGNGKARMNYLGSNYTHAIRDAVINGCNVIAQLVAKKEINGETVYSMSSNPDTNIEGIAALKELRSQGKKVACIAQVNTNMPFMYGDAVVEPSLYDMVIENPDFNFKIFGAPKEPVNSVDWMIGLRASTLVKDNGTIQVGIGSLGDAIVAGLQLRHKNNDIYKKFLNDADIYKNTAELIDEYGGTDVFNKGLLGSSEMLVDSLIELFKDKILKRKVYEDVRLQKVINENGFNETQVKEIFKALIDGKHLHAKIKPKEVKFLQHFGILKDGLKYDNGTLSDGNNSYSLDTSNKESLDALIDSCLGSKLKKGIAIYASFFIGPQNFYQDLRDMDEETLKLIDMRGVDYVNHLYGGEEIRRLQRINGRFINAGLMVTLSGAVVADGLEENRVISGPGGQYNFVSMAHALDDGRAVTMIRSTRGLGKNAVSNVVWQYGHTTIPRHLRDIIVTEYGIADLRGRKDWEVMTQLICIADSRFQADLLEKAKQGKIVPADWEIPEEFTNNTPEMIESKIEPYREKGFFQSFPFGTDLTDEEIVLGKALRMLKEKVQESGKFGLMSGLISKSMSSIPKEAIPYLTRMGLDKTSGMQEKLLQKMVIFALKNSGAI